MRHPDRASPRIHRLGRYPGSLLLAPSSPDGSPEPSPGNTFTEFRIPEHHVPSDSGPSPQQPPDQPVPPPDAHDGTVPSAAGLSAITRSLTWHQRAALRVLARTPCRIRQHENGSLHVDTQTSTHIAITTWRALERKGLAHRDLAAHPASAIGQRLALTPLGLSVLNHLTGRAFPPSTTRLWPPSPPRHFTAHPSAQHAGPPSARRR